MGTDMEDNICFGLLQVSSKTFPHFFSLKGLFIIIYIPSLCSPTLASHCPSPRVHPFRMAQLSIHRVSSQGSCMITNQTTLNLAHCFYPDSTTGWLNGTCCPSRQITPARAIRGPGFSQNFTCSFFIGCRGQIPLFQENLELLCIKQGLVVAASLETKGCLTEHSSVVNRHATYSV